MLGKITQQLDLLVGEWTHLLSVDTDRADKLVLLEYRNDEKRASAPQVGKGDNHRLAFEVKPPGSNVIDMSDLPCPFHVTQAALRVGTEQAGPRFDVFGRCVVERNGAETLTVVQIQHAELGPADARHMGQNGLEDRLQVARRA